MWSGLWEMLCISCGLNALLVLEYSLVEEDASTRGAEIIAAREKRVRAGAKAREIEKDIVIRRGDQGLAECLKVIKISFDKESSRVTGGVYKSTTRKYAKYLNAGLMALLGEWGFMSKGYRSGISHQR
jgi:hypothetical protein